MLRHSLIDWVLAWMAEQPGLGLDHYFSMLLYHAKNLLDRMRDVDVSTKHQLISQPHPSLPPDSPASGSGVYASYLPSPSGVAYVWFMGALLSIRYRREAG